MKALALPTFIAISMELMFGWTAGYAESRHLEGFLTDEKLANWTRSRQVGWILSISDRMPYSLLMVREVIEEAELQGLPLMVVSDREIPLQEKVLVNRSSVLKQAGALLHYPTLFMVQKGRISRRRLPGAIDRKQIRDYFRSLGPND
jgi:hypothetical protein